MRRSRGRGVSDAGLKMLIEDLLGVECNTGFAVRDSSVLNLILQHPAEEFCNTKAAISIS